MRATDRGAKNPDAVERGAFQAERCTAGTCEKCTRFLARIAVRTADLYIYMYAYTRTHVCHVLWLHSCVFTAIDRPSSYTHLSTCHYTSGTSVLCTVTLVKMTVSADARGYITRPIHATLIMAGIVIESRAFRPWAGFNLLLRHLRPTFARHCA